ncbi:MAG: hypothetical protein M1838_000322 [Thelocarpon superellum]|nr:MAG: hypothetical protein M1838_000322 [Thelocarpon superellum]
MAVEAATERSPLLSKDSDHVDVAPNEVEEVATYGVGSVTENGPAEEQPVESRNYEGDPEMQKRMKYMFPAFGVGVLLVAADQTLIVSSYGKVGSDLKALNLTSWIATGYLLTMTAFQPLYGKLSDIFGRKPALLFAYSVFGIGTLCCGVSRTMNELIASRALAGIGGGGMTTVVSILLSDIVALRDRGTWQGYINIIFALGAGAGAPLGGILADTVGWRWAFLGQVPLCLLAITVTCFALRLPAQDKADWKTKVRRVDFLGAVILVAAVFGLLVGLDRGSNESWKMPLAIAALSVSLVLFAAFVLVEVKVAAEPFAPGRIIFDRSLFASYLCNFFAFGGYMGVLFYIPLYYQAVEGLSASAAGVRLIPAVVSGVSGSLFGGIYMKITGKYYWLTVLGYTAVPFGALAILLSAGLIVQSTLGICVGLVICGFGNGIGVTSSLIALLSNTSTEDQAVATACSYLFRSLGSVVGLSLSATVVQQYLRAHLRAALENGKAADEIVRRVRESLDYINTLEPAIRDVVRVCYGEATRAGFLMNLIFASGAMISAVWILEKKLSK